MFLVLVLLLLSTTSIAEIVTEKMKVPIEEGDLTFLRALNNYFGCKEWIDGECT